MPKYTPRSHRLPCMAAAQQFPANAGRLEARARELRGDTGFIDGHARRPCLAVGPLFRSGDPSNILYSRLSPLVVLLRHT